MRLENYVLNWLFEIKGLIMYMKKIMVYIDYIKSKFYFVHEIILLTIFYVELLILKIKMFEFFTLVFY